MSTFSLYIQGVASGGKRAGAGRRAGSKNLVTSELREKIDGSQLIQFLESVADGSLEGATLANRVLAATILLRKTLPDYKQIDFKQSTEPTLVIVKSHIPNYFTED